MAPPASLICSMGSIATHDVFAVTFDILEALAPEGGVEVVADDAA